MRKLSLIVSLLFCAVLPVVTFAITPTIYLRESPIEKAKVIASMKAGEQLMPIIYTQKRDWVKVANPINGDVGWAKVDELKGPLIILKTNGSKTQQQIIINKNNKDKPQVYSIIQYSGPRELKPEEAKKVVQEMEKRHKKMEESMQKMQEQLQKNISEMFKDFDSNFYTFPVIQPIIVVPNSQSVDK